ncbi:hypothetical protein GQ457_11G007840 [Hibiscus cannabinus]
MYRAGLNPTHISYTALINGFIKQGLVFAGDLEKSKALIDEMVSIGVEPDTQTYNIMIESYCRQGNFVKVYELLEEMEKQQINIKQHSDFKVLDGLLDEVDDIQAADDLSGSSLSNLNSQSHTPGFSGSSSSAGGISESSVATVQESNNRNGVLKKMFCGDLRHTFKSKFGCHCQATVTDTTGPTIEHMQSFDESDDLVSFMLSTESVKSSVEVTKGGTLLRQKRLRKPTSRYIEEFSRNSTSGKKCLKAGSQGDLPQVELQNKRQITIKDLMSLNLIVSPLHLNLKLSKREPKDPKWLVIGGSVKGRRLMGFAQYGVGRWTDIKRLLFASSAYRTPVDLRIPPCRIQSNGSLFVRLSRSMLYVPYQCLWYAEEVPLKKALVICCKARTCNPSIAAKVCSSLHSPLTPAMISTYKNWEAWKGVDGKWEGS